MRIYIPTGGRPVVQLYSRLSRHPRLKLETAVLELKVGDASVSISFDSWDEMIAFCEKHNFSYNDGRTGVEKYLAKMGA